MVIGLQIARARGLYRRRELVLPRAATRRPRRDDRCHHDDRAAADRATVAGLARQSVGPTAPLLLELGGRYLCDQRVYPAGAGPHISAWEWAFDDNPGVLTEKLAKRLSDAEREESTFRWKGPDGAVQAVVTVEDASTKSRLDCKDISASTRSLIVAWAPLARCGSRARSRHDVELSIEAPRPAAGRVRRAP